MSKPTSIKTSEEVRNRLRILADERGTTITELSSALSTPSRFSRTARTPG
ncbi:MULTISPECIES: hypothetical protein [Streptomyces]|uniref:Uncharacterized protein n=1 Tax=Streptomyces mirabilis TaxID=68239 RepID=A0ABU3V3S4_9ACTN|nr:MULTISPECIES: hypothetical protein [Streptomyces]MCX4617340.1 hypothetical protein [Streptomyces mirabilis]MCX5356343.1 hypothetical protein [Streptomyces mirabilis]MDU9000843.1 hypothetical protein [Streptomyces mirabilis]